jgi:hypothetical protein
MDHEVCATFTALYDAMGGIGSGAMTVAKKEGCIEVPLFHGLTACAAEEWRA